MTERTVCQPVFDGSFCFSVGVWSVFGLEKGRFAVCHWMLMSLAGAWVVHRYVIETVHHREKR
jgi:hypothetical protein